MFQRTRHPAWMFFCAATLVVLSAFPLAAQQTVGPMVFQDVHHDVSSAVRDMPTINSAGNAATANIKHEAEPARRIPLPPGMGGVQLGPVGDAAVQSSAVAAPAGLAPTVGLGFEGLGTASLDFTVTSAPPDTNGAVGATQYVQWVNTSFAVFNKSTGALIAGPIAGNHYGRVSAAVARPITMATRS